MNSTFFLSVTLAMLLTAPTLTATAIESLTNRAEVVLSQYFTMPASTASDLYGNARVARLGILRTLAGIPNALSTVQAAFPSITNGWQRAELAEMLGRNIQTKESALVLINLFNDS